jgi:hypothetical protein
MPAVRSVVIASNYWHKPGIKVSFVHDEALAPSGAIHVEVDAADLMLAVAAELPKAWGLLTAAKRQAAVMQAFTTALEKIKESTVLAL